MSNLTLVIDQGSHASRSAIFSEQGDMLYLNSIDINTTSTAQNRYEQSADEILDSIILLFDQLPDSLRHDLQQAGLCTQRSSFLAYDKLTGEALSPIISWRDTRNDKLVKHIDDSTKINIRKISGLPVSAHYAASKMQWLLQNDQRISDAQQKDRLIIAPLASYLLFHLLEEPLHQIDYSNAQRTQLFDINKLAWSEHLLNAFEISPGSLPSCKPMIYKYGIIRQLSVPLNTVCGDQNASIHAFPSLTPNNALINIGTGAFLLTPIAEKNTDHPSLLNTLSCNTNQHCEQLTEATVNGAGAALSWAQQHYPYDTLFEHLPRWLEHKASPPIFINTVSGLGSPWWCTDIKPEILHTNSQTQININDIYCAIIESVVFLLYNNLNQLQSLPDKIFISGGLSQLDGLCQTLANLSHVQVIRFNSTESSARGCAWMTLQLSTTGNTHWRDLSINKNFYSAPDKKLEVRYKQFIGELAKRCNSN